MYEVRESNKSGFGRFYIWESQTSHPIGEIFEKDQAELIVRAVNSYEPMQARIKELEDFVAYTYGYTLNTSNKALFEKAESLLQSSRQL
ncbi:MAG TPA: hypothetical protein VFD46_11295 [Chryseolinea sp.]|nr:hypothetical protein [Chryseolinea sp.]